MAWVWAETCGGECGMREVFEGDELLSFKRVKQTPAGASTVVFLTTQQDRLHGMFIRQAHGKWFWGLMVALCQLGVAVACTNDHEAIASSRECILHMAFHAAFSFTEAGRDSRFDFETLKSTVWRQAQDFDGFGARLIELLDGFERLCVTVELQRGDVVFL